MSEAPGSARRIPGLAVALGLGRQLALSKLSDGGLGAKPTHGLSLRATRAAKSSSSLRSATSSILECS